MTRRAAGSFGFALALALLLAGAIAAHAQPADSIATDTRPFVAGGYDDKPYLTGVFGRIRVGGYVEANGIWEREDGVTSHLGFELTRWNLLAATDFGSRVRVFSEVEIEDGGEEVTLELAQVDVRIVPAFSARAGMLLLPLGRFNLTHDAPRNELPSRPAEAEQLLGVALAQPGLGGFGQLDGNDRLTWELYTVTGYTDAILTGSPDGTRLPAGRRNPEDQNASPAFVGRIEWSRSTRLGVGLSGYLGAYNTFKLDGMMVDERRDVVVAVLDLEVPIGPLQVSGEVAHVNVDIDPSLTGLFASRQGGFYFQLAFPVPDDRFERTGLQWTGAARIDAVDFDEDLAGDSMKSLTLGVNLRPVPQAAIKLAWVRGQTHDRFDNAAQFARMELGVATYF